MRFKIRSTPPKNLEVWHKWFAWRPVFIVRPDGRSFLVWLGHVERKMSFTALAELSWWEYRFMEDANGRP